VPRSKLRWPGGPTQFTSVIPRAYRLEPLGTDAPTPAAQHRYDVVRWYEEHGRGVRLAARHFGHSPDTVSRWVRALDRRGMRGLEDKSRRPKQVRRPTTQLDQVRRIRELPEQYPRWGREKLRLLLLREGIAVSPRPSTGPSARLRARGELHEPPTLRKALRAQARAALRPRRPPALVADGLAFLQLRCPAKCQTLEDRSSSRSVAIGIRQRAGRHGHESHDGR